MVPCVAESGNGLAGWRRKLAPARLREKPSMGAGKVSLKSRH